MNSFRALIHFAICSTAIAAITGTANVATCADPTLTTVYGEMFNPFRTAHMIRSKIDILASYDSSVGTTDNFQYQGPVFLAWRNPQNFTVPIYQLGSGNLNINSDFIFLPEVNGNPPTPPSGYANGGIVGYAYSTQVCGSVPLYAAANAANTDHYWTTNLNDHNALIGMAGWVDDGIPFYVLPLDAYSY